ncbi:TnsD family Tn7-like transposition protein [Lysinibacillus fusiformis]|uniref:TnsD family Tn7-like transposition protein n=1 Tax=Lysinibacillus fusiformis TaxID=28031 RepID=UPI003CFAC358
MLSYFPKPYKDELYYSILARYHYHMGNIGNLQTMKELLGKFIKVNFELPKGIDYLTSEVQFFSENYTRDYFINNHTIIPFVKPFKTESWNKSLENNNFERSSVALFRPRKEDVYFKNNLFYCSECISEQIEKYGESYWNRIHQIPGVYVCTRHKILLKKYSIKLLDLRKMDFTLPPSTQDNEITTTKPEIIEKLYKLAIDVEYILKKNYGFLPESYYVKKYEALIGNRGFLYPINQRKKKLNELIVEYHSIEFLELLNSSLNINTWSPSMIGLYELNNLHPIRHILIMQLLCGSAANFFENDYTYEPFGKGPWICMNSLSNHYLESVVKIIDTKISKYDGRIYGVVKCECGYEYRLREWEKSPLEIKNIGVRVENRGEMWYREFKKLIDDNKTMKEISEITKLSWDTIVRQKEKICKLDNKSKELKGNKEVINYRKQYLQLKDTYPDLSRTEIARRNLGTYNWLIRNDRDWYELNAPKSQNGNKLKEDYSEDDIIILAKARLLISGWSKYEKELNKLIRKSKWRLLEQLKIRKNDEVLKKHYPKTFKFLQENIEATEDFYKRKINVFLESNCKNEKVTVRKIINENKLDIRVGSNRWKLVEQLVEVHNSNLRTPLLHD